MATPSSLTSEAYLRAARQEIAAWENPRRGYLARLGDMALNPAAKFTARLVPDQVQNAVSLAIEKSLRLAAHAGKFSVDNASIFKERIAKLGRKRLLGTRLKTCDAMAKRFWNSHCGYAAAEGAATGLAGFAGFVADVPLILSIAIREIRSIAACFGYDGKGREEIDYVLHILRLASTGEEADKIESLNALHELERRFAQQAAAAEAGERQKIPPVKHLISLQEYAKSMALGMIKRHALQMVPLAGAVTGASFNALYANDVGRAAYMCYRRRFLLEAEAMETARLARVMKEGKARRKRGG